MSELVIRYIKEVFASHKFQSKSEPEKQLAIDKLLNNSLVTNAGINREQIMQLYEEQTRLTTDIMKKLGRDPLFLILTKSRPKDVLSLCQTTSAFVKLCRDDTVFARLLDLHYPNRDPNIVKPPIDSSLIASLAPGERASSEPAPPKTMPMKDLYMMLTYSYQVWTCGINRSGQLGQDDNQNRSIPTPIKGFNTIIQLSCGGSHTAMIDISGQVWTFGNNDYGQLGYDSDSGFGRDPLVRPIKSFNNIKQVSCGDQHTAMIDSTGQVWTFGLGHYGRLGHNNRKTLREPKDIANFSNAIQVSCGMEHTAIIDAKGQLWTFGRDNGGRLGHHYLDKEDKLKPTVVKDSNGNNFNNIVQVSCGNYHTAMIDGTGQIWTFGDDQFGQLGHGDFLSKSVPTKIKEFENVVEVACGGVRTTMIDITGQVWIFGSSGDFNGAGPTNKGNKSKPEPIVGFSDIKHISCSNFHTAMINNLGQALTFGNGVNGALGHGDQNGKSIPTVVEGLDGVVEVSCGGSFTAFLVNNY